MTTLAKILHALRASDEPAWLTAVMWLAFAIPAMMLLVAVA